MKNNKENISYLGDSSFNGFINSVATTYFILYVMFGYIIITCAIIALLAKLLTKFIIILILICLAGIILTILFEDRAFKKWKQNKLLEIEKCRNKLINDINDVNIYLDKINNKGGE